MGRSPGEGNGSPCQYACLKSLWGGFNFKLFGHDVVLMSELLVSSKETILYGDPKAYKLNVFKALEVKPFETATTTNLQFRGATMADGELIDAAAVVRFAQA